MTKFLLLYTATSEVREQMQKMSPEDMKAGMEPWTKWFSQVGENMVDMGAQLGHAMTVTKEGEQPGNPEITGYTIISAENIEGAMKAAQMNPLLEREGTSVEVHELLPMAM